MPPENVVERIRKLLALTEAAGATEAEAAAALERANALLLRHNLTMDQVAIASGAVEPVTEGAIRIGWAGNWRGSLLNVLARHNLCQAITVRQGKVDTVVTVGRADNVQATTAMYEWIAAQVERFALEEWGDFNRDQKADLASHPRIPWCAECEHWTPTYRDVVGARLRCDICDRKVLREKPMIHAFTWKTAFYRGAVLRISNRLHDQRTAQTATQAQPSAQVPAVALDGSQITALVLRTDEENATYIARHYGELHSGRARRSAYHGGAYARGQARGGDVSLTAARALRGEGE